MTFDFTTIDLRVLLAALAIIVAVVTAFYFQWWRNRKKLSYELLSNVLISSSKQELQDKIEIRYEGKPVKDVHFLIIKLINDGSVPIKKEDFEKSITFDFPGATILTAERLRFSPENIGTAIESQDNSLKVTPALFNPKDYIQLKLLLSGYKNMEIDARIVGVSRIRLVNNSPVSLLIPIFTILMTLIFLLLALLQLGASDNSFYSLYKWRILAVISLFCLQVLLIAFLLHERTKRRRQNA